MLQRFVEVTRGYLDLAASMRPDVLHVRQGLARIERLLTTLHKAREEVDALCPGMQAELSKFVEMARKHCKEIDPPESNTSDDESITSGRKNKKAIQKERARNRDAKYQDDE